MKIKLGQKVKDQITGFSGVATGRTEYITGCEQFLVQPPTKADGTFAEPRWFDVDRLTVIEQEKISLTVKKPGFDLAAPAR